jgi:uncharacterized lipoprotein
MSMAVEARIEDGALRDLALVPVFIERDADPRWVAPADPRFQRILDYLRAMTAEAGFATRYSADGDVIRPTRNEPHAGTGPPRRGARVRRSAGTAIHAARISLADGLATMLAAVPLEPAAARFHALARTAGGGPSTLLAGAPHNRRWRRWPTARSPTRSTGRTR